MISNKIFPFSNSLFNALRVLVSKTRLVYASVLGLKLSCAKLKLMQLRDDLCNFHNRSRHRMQNVKHKNTGRYLGMI